MHSRVRLNRACGAQGELRATQCTPSPSASSLRVADDPLDPMGGIFSGAAAILRAREQAAMEMLPSSRVLPSGPSRQHPAIYRDLPGQENYCRRYIQACCLMRPRFLAPYPCLSPTAWPHEACVALGRCSPRARRGPSPVLQQRLEAHKGCFQSHIGLVGRARRGILAADCAAGPLSRRGTCA